MSTFIAIPHRPEVAVKYEKQEDVVTISVDECPNVSDPQLEIFQEIVIPVEYIPGLIRALQDAYEYATTEKP